MGKTYKVYWSKRVNRQLQKTPDYIRDKFLAWVIVVENFGIFEARKSPGFHDEPLSGKRRGQRSIRLSRSYRAIYQESRQEVLEIIEVIGVTKHEY